MRAKPIDIKLWPVDENGDQIMTRPGFHSFAIEDGMWVILRYEDGSWSARFLSDAK